MSTEARDVSASPQARSRSGFVPGPARRVRGSWLAGAVGAALVAAALVLWGLGRVADRREVVVVRAPVAAGAPIPVEALGTTLVAVDSPTQLFSAAQLDDLVGKVASTDLRVGDLLGPSMLTAGASVPEGWEEVGALLPAGSFPVSIRIGDRMRAFPGEGDLAGVEVLVMEVSIGDDRAAQVVVAVPSVSAGQIAQWSADDNLVLTRMVGS